MSGTLMTDVSVSSRPMTESPLTERQWVRRGELLEAARRVFERDGYHAATVSSIVQMAGLSQGAFYLYFGDKKAVFAALQEEMATLLRRRIYWATRNQSDPASRLTAGLTAYFEFYDEYRNWMRRLTVEGLGIDESFEARQVQLYETLAGGLNATYQFDLTGESWTLKIADGAATVSPGAAQSPNTTLIASTDDWMNIATGKLNPVQAFMQQKLKVKGDMGLAMKLQGLLQ